MDKPTHLIEFETMLVGRHTLLAGSRSRHNEGRLDRSAYLLLSGIEVQGPLSIGQLSEALRLDTSTLNRQTAAMLRAGVVERIPDPEGGIARKFSITDEGRRRLSEDRAHYTGGLDRVFADWTAGEVAEFAAFFRRFNGDIERLEGVTWPRPGEAAQQQAGR